MNRFFKYARVSLQRAMKLYPSIILFTVVLVLIVVRVTMRNISEPLTLLCEGLDQTAEGNYSHRIHSTRSATYQSTFQTYNSMNEHITKLIAENYEVKLSEKELEIQMLNMQFNPHFLYNMLNTISLMALESGHDKVSSMLSKLSYMMRYSAKTTSGTVPLREDMHYIEAYISAMQLRANDKFEYICDVDEELLSHSVPKFMLQPFVENAIQHGFSALRHILRGDTDILSARPKSADGKLALRADAVSIIDVAVGT